MELRVLLSLEVRDDEGSDHAGKGRSTGRPDCPPVELSDSHAVMEAQAAVSPARFQALVAGARLPAGLMSSAITSSSTTHGTAMAGAP